MGQELLVAYAVRHTVGAEIPTARARPRSGSQERFAREIVSSGRPTSRGPSTTPARRTRAAMAPRASEPHPSTTACLKQWQTRLEALN